MIHPLSQDYLFLEGKSSFLLAGIVFRAFHLFIETHYTEHCQYLKEGDLIVVSAPEGGEIGQAIILLELIREYHAPLVVLPKGHPGSTRFKMVVSAGDHIELHCSIQRGTHPEQHLLCGSEEMAGLVLKRANGGIEISGGEHLQVRLYPRLVIGYQ